MSSLAKGESMGTKLVELFANRVIERRNMIKKCIDSYVDSIHTELILQHNGTYNINYFTMTDLKLMKFTMTYKELRNQAVSTLF
jgi:hypothetical protein